MLIEHYLIPILLSTIHLEIAEPIDGETYCLSDSLNVRAILDLRGEAPGSVDYCLNGDLPIQMSKLDTDWFTYMGTDNRHGFSESAVPLQNTVLWTAQVTGDWIEFANPVIVDETVYYASNNGTDSLYALDAITGDLLWKYRVGPSVFPASVYNGNVFIAADSLFCINALTGTKVWASDVASASSGTPVVVDNMVFCGKQKTVYCVSEATGEVIWQKLLPFAQCSSLTVWNNIVFVPTFYLHSDASIFALNASNGEIIWQNTTYQGYYRSSPVIADSTLFINGADGYSRSIDVFSGECNWVKAIDPGQEILGTPAYFDGYLYFCRAPNYYCLDAETGSIVWIVPGYQLGSCCIADGLLFYCETYNPNNARLIALDCENGTEIWTFSTNTTTMQSSPAITDGIIYFAAEDWNLYAIGTGLRYTYFSEYLSLQTGYNQLITTATWGSGNFVADTISFFVNDVGTEQMEHEISGNRHIFNLYAFPNPLNSFVDISFQLDYDEHCFLEIFDFSGRTVASLVSSEMERGTHTVRWNGCNQSGEEVSTGIYFCRLEFRGIIKTTGLCLLR